MQDGGINPIIFYFGVDIMHLLNEEIRGITLTLSHLEKAIPLEDDTKRKLKLKEHQRELNELLLEKLNQLEDYKG